MTNANITVRFWGVRGSVPSPIAPAAVEAKMRDALVVAARDGSLPRDASPEAVEAWMQKHLSFAQRSTFGGNTTCVELRCDDELIIFDMGTGLRELGNALIGQTIRDKGMHATVLQSHVHWDHIQGYPFMPQIYMPRKSFDNRFTFYGGKDWHRSLEEALRYQMSDPMFPVPHGEIERVGLKMDFNTVWNGREMTIDGKHGKISVLCHKLNHPQETYGYRVEYRGKVVTFCTDHEPYGAGLNRDLLALVKDTDLFITDCQYTLHEYTGEGGKVQKQNWGHSFPEYIADVARAANAKRVATTHHDPSASDGHVVVIADQVAKVSGVSTLAAHEGLTIAV
jgi:phosphoribosyl 1,2-cyclic phosphodiesterase